MPNTSKQDAEGFDVPSNPSGPAEQPATQPAPDAQPPSGDAPPAPPEVKPEPVLPDELPDCLTASIALLQKCERLPERNDKEEAEKAKLLNRIRPHVFQLQQLPGRVDISADDIASQSKMQAANVKAERLKALAREHREVEELLAENAILRAKLKKAGK